MRRDNLATGLLGIVSIGSAVVVPAYSFWASDPRLFFAVTPIALILLCVAAILGLKKN